MKDTLMNTVKNNIRNLRPHRDGGYRFPMNGAAIWVVPEEQCSCDNKIYKYYIKYKGWHSYEITESTYQEIVSLKEEDLEIEELEELIKKTEYI